MTPRRHVDGIAPAKLQARERVTLTCQWPAASMRYAQIAAKVRRSRAGEPRPWLPPAVDRGRDLQPGRRDLCRRAAAAGRDPDSRSAGGVAGHLRQLVAMAAVRAAQRRPGRSLRPPPADV